MTQAPLQDDANEGNHQQTSSEIQNLRILKIYSADHKRWVMKGSHYFTVSIAAIGVREGVPRGLGHVEGLHGRREMGVS